MLSTKMSNESGYMFIVIDCEDKILAAFHRVDIAVDSVAMSFDPRASVRLDDRYAEFKSYSVILVDPCNGGEEEYHGCIIKQPVNTVAVGIAGLS